MAVRRRSPAVRRVAPARATYRHSWFCWIDVFGLALEMISLVVSCLV
jgi:hypothetical protein